MFEGSETQHFTLHAAYLSRQVVQDDHKTSCTPTPQQHMQLDHLHCGMSPLRLTDSTHGTRFLLSFLPLRRHAPKPAAPERVRKTREVVVVCECLVDGRRRELQRADEIQKRLRPLRRQCARPTHAPRTQYSAQTQRKHISVTLGAASRI